MVRTTEVILQTSTGIVPSLTTGEAILYIGLFGIVTMLVMKLNSALSVLAWSLTGVMLVLTMLGQVGAEIYFVALMLTMLSIGATGAYTTRYA